MRPPLLMSFTCRLRSDQCLHPWGMATGYATLGTIGFEGRMDYGAVGIVTILASRLCSHAEGGQILTNQKTLSQIEHLVEAEPIGELHLQGFSRALPAFNIAKFKE